jgi:hypothetical protein
MPFETAAILAAAALLGLAILAHTVLRAWNGWLDLKRTELARGSDQPLSLAAGLIDLSDLKERLRKLEAIAAGVDL